jgi:hypothetical protein
MAVDDDLVRPETVRQAAFFTLNDNLRHVRLTHERPLEIVNGGSAAPSQHNYIDAHWQFKRLAQYRVTALSN